MSELSSVQQALQSLMDEVVKETGVAVLFTDASCQVADAVEPKLRAALERQFPQLRFTVVSRADAPELLGQLGVFSFPTVVVWFAGKETARFVRTFSVDQVAEAIERPYAILFGN